MLMNSLTFKKFLFSGILVACLCLIAIYSITKSKANAKGEVSLTPTTSKELEFNNEINDEFTSAFINASQLANQGQDLINRGNLVVDSAFKGAC